MDQSHRCPAITLRKLHEPYWRTSCISPFVPLPSGVCRVRMASMCFCRRSQDLAGPVKNSRDAFQGQESGIESRCPREPCWTSEGFSGTRRTDVVSIPSILPQTLRLICGGRSTTITLSCLHSVHASVRRPCHVEE